MDIWRLDKVAWYNKNPAVTFGSGVRIYTIRTYTAPTEFFAVVAERNKPEDVGLRVVVAGVVKLIKTYVNRHDFFIFVVRYADR